MTGRWLKITASEPAPAIFIQLQPSTPATQDGFQPGSRLCERYGPSTTDELAHPVYIKIPLGMRYAILTAETTRPQWLFHVGTPFWASAIQNRSSSSIALSANAMIKAFGAGTASTRSG